jgi:hypothetical protein
MEKAANSMGLEINEGNSKYMVTTNKEARRNNLGKNLVIGDHNFEVVEEFKYLGTLINTKIIYIRRNKEKNYSDQ